MKFFHLPHDLYCVTALPSKTNTRPTANIVILDITASKRRRHSLLL